MNHGKITRPVITNIGEEFSQRHEGIRIHWSRETSVHHAREDHYRNAPADWCVQIKSP